MVMKAVGAFLVSSFQSKRGLMFCQTQLHSNKNRVAIMGLPTTLNFWELGL